MAHSNYGPTDVQSFPAAVDLDSATGYFGKITATGVDLTADGEAADGIIVNVEKAGVGATIGLMTTAGKKAPLVVGAAVAAGDGVSSDAAGKGNTATAGDAINGKVLEAATADTNIVTCLFGYKGQQA